MLRDNNDIKLFNDLVESLTLWEEKNKTLYNHKDYNKETGSLYRFGYWYFYDYKYSISGWKIKDGLVTFENETTGDKVKYSIPNSEITHGLFERDNIIKVTRRIISKWLKDLSDKLHP